MAASAAMIPAVESALWFCKKISPSEPSSNRLAVVVNLGPPTSSVKVYAAAPVRQPAPDCLLHDASPPGAKPAFR